MLKLTLLLVPAAVLLAAVRPEAPERPTEQDRFAQVEIKATAVRGGVHMLEGSGGNIGLCVGDDGVLMIDDQYAPLADKILAKVKEVAGAAPDTLINTHHHGDHTGGNAFFGGDATVVAHRNVRRRLAADGSSPAEALPDITYATEMTLHFGSETVRLIHYAGCHTDGDTVVLFEESNVAHLGDLFFSGMFPFVDLDSGGNVAHFIAAIEDLCDTLPDEVKIIPGHGPLSDLEDLRAYLDMLTATTEHVVAARKEGRTVREIQAAGLPPEWRDWAWQFINADRWIDIVFRSGSTGDGDEDG